MNYRDVVHDLRHRVTDCGKPVWLGHPVFSDPAYGGKHPLSIPRLANVVALLEALNLDHDPRQFATAPLASAEQIERYHRPDYVRHVLACETQKPVLEDIRRFNVGTAENPIFPGMLTRIGAACGGAIAGAEALAGLRQGTIFCPGSGAHHAAQNRASSFCYFNDPVLAILKMQDHGLKRIAYVDIDAHPGDGVEKAFRSYPDMLTISLHQAYGAHHRESVISAKTGRINIVMPDGAGDQAYQSVMDTIISPVLAQFKPEVMVIQAGCDALAEDPLSRLKLSNGQYWDMVDEARAHAPRVLVLGGGGYHPWSVARAWTGLWARLNDHEIADPLPMAAQQVLTQINHPAFAAHPSLYPDDFAGWCQSLYDPPRPGPEMPEIEILQQMMQKEDFRAQEPAPLPAFKITTSSENLQKTRSVWR